MYTIKDNTLKLYHKLNLLSGQYELLKNLKRFNIVVCHRRWGKTTALINYLFLSWLMCKKKNPIFVYLAPDEEQAKRNVWTMLKDLTSLVPNVKVHETTNTITVNLNDGCGERKIYLSGIGTGNRADNLRGSYIDGIIIDETKDMPEGVWESVIQPMLSDRRGWAIITGTMGLGYYYDLYTTTLAQVKSGTSNFNVVNISLDDSKRLGTNTGARYEEERQQLKQNMSREKFEMEYMNNPSTPGKGSFFGAIITHLQDEGFIGADRALHNPNHPVYVSMDLGYHDETVAIFWQVYNGKYYAVDYRFWTRTLYKDIIQEINAFPYHIGGYLLPHDARKRDGASVKGSFEDTLRRECNIPYHIAVNPGLTGRRAKVGGKRQLYDNTRELLSRVEINSFRCERLIHALNLFGAKWNHKTGTTDITPEKSWAQHSADALQTFTLLCDKIDQLNSRIAGNPTQTIVTMDSGDVF